MEYKRFKAEDLQEFSLQLLLKTGLEKEKADAVAEILIEGDLMGHVTHGLQLLPGYIDELVNGRMEKAAQPELVSDQGSAITMDGNYLPGPWLTLHAMELAFQRIASHPVVTIVIRRSHHIGCLAAYPKRATDKNLFMLLSCSDPSIKTVAPFGGIEPLYTPNPLAAGIPTDADPIILDISMSSVANGAIAKAKREQKKMAGNWILSSQGIASNNPKDFFSDPPGTVLPLGGMDLGYKGFALGLLIETMTSALGGHGRSDQPSEWGASVFLQIINPEAFGGFEKFKNETSWFRDACKASTPISDGSPVRLPGENGLKNKVRNKKNGISIPQELSDSLNSWAEKFGLSLPKSI